MRFMSNGGAFPSIIDVIRGSFITFALTRSRCARERYTMYEKNTTSPGLRATLRANENPLPALTSSATHSRNASAPCSFQTSAAFAAMRRYAWTLRFGTASTKPSTYSAMVTPPFSLELAVLALRRGHRLGLELLGRAIVPDEPPPAG